MLLHISKLRDDGMFSQIREEMHNMDTILFCIYSTGEANNVFRDLFFLLIQINVSGRDRSVEPEVRLSASVCCLLKKIYEFSRAQKTFLLGMQIYLFFLIILHAICTKNTQVFCHHPH